MLDHLHRGDEIILALDRLDPNRAIVDLEPACRSMRPRRLDQLGRGIDPGHFGAHPRHRLAQQPRPAADVERTLPAKWPHHALV